MRMILVLTVFAVLLAVLGFLSLIQGDLIYGILLLVLAAAVGPGGWSVFSRGR